MSISFPCGECGRRYELGDELAGKRFRCKKCASIVTVPTPRKPSSPPVSIPPVPAPPRAAEPNTFAAFDDLEDEDEAVSSAFDEDDEQADESEEEEEYVRPAFTPSRRGAGRAAKTAASSGPNWLLIAGIGGATVFLGVLIGVAVWAFQSSAVTELTEKEKQAGNVNEKDFPQAPSAADVTVEQEKILRRIVDNFHATITLLRGVKDAETASDAAPRLKKILLENLELQKRLTRLPNNDPQKEAAVREKFAPEMKTAFADYMKELLRIQTVKGKEPIEQMFQEVMKEGGLQMPGPNGMAQGYPGSQNARNPAARGNKPASSP